MSEQQQFSRFAVIAQSYRLSSITWLGLIWEIIVDKILVPLFTNNARWQGPNIDSDAGAMTLSKIMWCWTVFIFSDKFSMFLCEMFQQFKKKLRSIKSVFSCDLGSSWCTGRKRDWIQLHRQRFPLQLPMGPICALMGPLDPSYAVDPQFRWPHLCCDGPKPRNHWWAPNGTAGLCVANASEWVLPHLVVWSFSRLWSLRFGVICSPPSHHCCWQTVWQFWNLIKENQMQQILNLVDKHMGEKLQKSEAHLWNLNWDSNIPTRAGKSQSLICCKRLNGGKKRIWFSIKLLANKYFISGDVLNPESEGSAPSCKNLSRNFLILKCS